MAKVLITGINGYIAAHTAARFLQAGFSVRGTVRNKASLNVESLLRALSSPQKTGGGKVEIVEVPDITVEGAFDNAVQGVQAIAHLASPVSMADGDPTPMMKAAVDGTTSLLGSAIGSSQKVRSVVFMSSISAVYSPSPDRGPRHVFTSADWNQEAEAKVAELGDKTLGYITYQASKTAAEKALWKFVDEKKDPAWAGVNVTTFCPSPVLGPPLFMPSPLSGLSMRVKDVWDVMHGGEVPEASVIRGTFVDVRDVAEVVVKAVVRDLALGDGESKKRERLVLMAQDNVSPGQMAQVLREEFGDRLKGVIRESQEGEKEEVVKERVTLKKFDSEPARKVLGRDWKMFRDSVVDSARFFRGV
ncbi:putative oxidoreductase [Triangularia verruculosa]|uniref:Oxidoreductase n=1 Tax=Triangularia verruculosa TaxID=2587418 RepID=A0AAN6XI46_9PEZI|nr:putative oxidoreductase [Triangularia verruculosa]